LADFIKCLAENDTFHPNFDDAVEVQKLLSAVESSAQSKSWTSVSTDQQ